MMVVVKPDGYMTVHQAAAKLDMKAKDVFRAINLLEMSSVRIGGMLFLKIEDINRFDVEQFLDRWGSLS